MKHISTCQVMWTNKIIATGYLKFHKSSISILSTAKDWLSDVGSHLLEFLALTSLKTTKVQLLLWHLSAVAMLRNFCEPQLRRRGIDLSLVWFQQDGATAHTARTSMSVLREVPLHHSCSNPFLTNTSVAAARTSGFRLSVFRFLVSPPFPWYTHAQCITHPFYQFQLQRKSCRTYGWGVVSSVVSKSTNISFSSVILSAKNGG